MTFTHPVAAVDYGKRCTLRTTIGTAAGFSAKRRSLGV